LVIYTLAVKSNELKKILFIKTSWNSSVFFLLVKHDLSHKTKVAVYLVYYHDEIIEIIVNTYFKKNVKELFIEETFL
jgi:hypothetical protein